jgi:hypothetical protein
MAKRQCRSCGGIYFDPQRDGLAYYHSCPPVTLVTVERLGVELEVALDQVLALDKELSRRDVPRPNARDENITLHRDGTRDSIVAEGAGAIELSDKAVR